MPQLTTTTVKAQEVRKGDMLIEAEASAVRSGVTVFNHTDAAQVVSATRAVKNVTIETTLGRVIIVADSDVIVTREGPTDEEKAAAEREQTVWQLRRSLESLTKNPAEAFIEKMNQNLAKNYAAVASHWDVDNFLSAQALYKQGKHIEATLERITTMDRYAGLTEDELLVTAFAIFEISSSERSYNSNPLSRSTSITSNLFDDLDTWAVRKIIEDDLRWASKAYRARVAELLATKNDNY